MVDRPGQGPSVRLDVNTNCATTGRRRRLPGGSTFTQIVARFACKTSSEFELEHFDLQNEPPEAATKLTSL
jgi:hypothetical protein